jgi:hypothetical protein
MPEIASLLEKWKSNHVPGTDQNENIPNQIVTVAENVFSQGLENNISINTWHEFLNYTRKPQFLQTLSDPGRRERWAEVVFKILQHTRFSLRDLLNQRVEEHPNKVLFKDMSSAVAVDWTYEQISRRLRETASLFFISSEARPRVAIYTENCLEGACALMLTPCFRFLTI